MVKYNVLEDGKILQKCKTKLEAQRIRELKNLIKKGKYSIRRAKKKDLCIIGAC